MELKIKNNLNYNKNTSLFIDCKDHSVSKEKFKLIRNEEYDLLITEPIPDNLGSYYESEEYISHTDSSEGIINKIYQSVRKYTISRKIKLINNYSNKSKSILDIGCGTGDFIKECKNNNWEVTGIEPNSKARDIGRTKDLVIFNSIDELNNQKFDIITMWHVLEHVTNLDETINKIKNMLTENGTLIIAVPNYKSYDATYYKSFWAAYDVPRHVWHFSKNSISRIFDKFKMEVVNIKPMLFDSFYVSMLSEKYKKGKNNFIMAFIIGLYSNFRGLFTKEYSSHIYILKNKK